MKQTDNDKYTVDLGPGKNDSRFLLKYTKEKYWTLRRCVILSQLNINVVIDFFSFFNVPTSDLEKIQQSINDSGMTQEIQDVAYQYLTCGVHLDETKACLYPDLNAGLIAPYRYTPDIEGLMRRFNPYDTKAPGYIETHYLVGVLNHTITYEDPNIFSTPVDIETKKRVIKQAKMSIDKMWEAMNVKKEKCDRFVGIMSYIMEHVCRDPCYMETKYLEYQRQLRLIHLQKKSYAKVDPTDVTVTPKNN